MGVESFFITANTNYEINIIHLKKFFLENNFFVSNYIKRYGGIFSKKIVSPNDIVVENIILCTPIAENELCFQACFSCYEKAVNIISHILIKMQSENIIKQIYYNSQTFNIYSMSQSDIVNIINELNFERWNYFKDNYTAKVIDLLPNEFYFYYNKHRNLLKR